MHVHRRTCNPFTHSHIRSEHLGVAVIQNEELAVDFSLLHYDRPYDSFNSIRFNSIRSNSRASRRNLSLWIVEWVMRDVDLSRRERTMHMGVAAHPCTVVMSCDNTEEHQNQN